MGTKPPRLSAIMTAVVFALSCFCFTLFVWISFGGTVPFAAKGYRVHVLFGPEAANLTSNAQVRIAGVPVGKVVATDPKNGRIDATLQLDSRYVPLPSDARALIRVKTLLGESFVALTPGSRSAPKLPDGGALPVSNVATAQQLDEVLGAFDAKTRASLKQFLGDLSKALEGRDEDLSAALGNVGPATERAAQLAVILDRQDRALRSVVRDSGTALRSLASRRADLRRLITSANDVFATTASRDRELTATVRALPAFLRQLRATSSDVEGAALDAAPLLHTLRPVASDVGPALAQTRALAPDLTRLVEGLDPIATAARKGLPALDRILRAARPLTDVLDPTGEQSIPVVELLGAFKQEIVTSVASLGASTQAATDYGPGTQPFHYLRFLTPFNNELFYGQSTRPGSNRANPYLAPGAMTKLATGLEAFDCRPASNPNAIPPFGGSVVPCKEQAAWAFRGLTLKFPHVRAGR